MVADRIQAPVAVAEVHLRGHAGGGAEHDVVEAVAVEVTGGYRQGGGTAYALDRTVGEFPGNAGISYRAVVVGVRVDGQGADRADLGNEFQVARGSPAWWPATRHDQHRRPTAAPGR